MADVPRSRWMELIEGSIRLNGLIVPINSHHHTFLNAMNRQTQPDEICLMVYPKSGTNWLRNMAWNITHGGVNHPIRTNAKLKALPHIEVVPESDIQQLPKPKMYSTHLGFNHLSYSPVAKYVYMARNPLDTCISNYFFFFELFNVKFPDFNEYFDMFIQGDMFFGDYTEHLQYALQHKNDANVLFLTYEEAKADRQGTILKLAKFLDVTYAQQLETDPPLLSRILTNTSFESMKENLPFYWYAIEKGVMLKEDMPFNLYRRGVVGDWKRYMTTAQARHMYDWVAGKIGIQELETLWPNMLG